MTAHPFRSIAAILAVAALPALAACSSSDDGADATSTAGDSPAATTSDTGEAPTSIAEADETAETTVPEAAGTDAATTVPAEVTAAPTTAPATTYIVAAGDSLSLISDRTCMSIAELAAANGWKNGANHVIHPGDVVQITPGACDGPVVPAEYALPYVAPPTRTATSGACDAVLAAYDALFAGPPTDATADAARSWATGAVVELRASVEALQPPIDVTGLLDALAAGEPAVAAAYVTFLTDTTNFEAFTAMNSAADATGLTRYAIAIAIDEACPTP